MGENAEIIRDFLAAREIAEAVAANGGDPEDVATAIEALRDIHDYLVNRPSAAGVPAARR